MHSLTSFKNSEAKVKGRMGSWRYCFHGFDCCFENVETEQLIEVSLVHGEEFGALDPFFFFGFIESTRSYHPLPIDLFERYSEGKRIIDRMLQLGKFEWINSNIRGRRSAVVKDREKVIVKELVTFT